MSTQTREPAPSGDFGTFWTHCQAPPSSEAIPSPNRLRVTVGRKPRAIEHRDVDPDGSISGVQRLTGTSRKIIRDNLRRLALYPWPAAMCRVLGLGGMLGEVGRAR